MAVYEMEEFINGLVEKTGISKEQAEKVIDFLKEHAEDIPKMIGQNEFLHGLAEKLPGGIGEKLGL